MSPRQRGKFTRREALQLGAASSFFAITPLRFGRGQSAAPYRIGAIGSYSGFLAESGAADRRGMQLCEKLINEAGGVGGRPLELVFFDTQSKAENARVGAEKLIGGGITLIMGAQDSGTTMAALQVTDPAKVPLIVEMSAASQITEQGYQYLFKNFPSGVTLVRDAVAQIKNLMALTHVEFKTAVLLHTNDTFGQSIAAGIKQTWTQLGIQIEIIGVVSYDPRARDLSTEIAKVRSLNPELLMPVTRVQDAIQLVREMVKQDFNPKAIIGPGSPGPYQKEFTYTLGKYCDYIMVSAPWYNPKSAETKKALAAFSKMYPKHRFDLDTGFGYEAVMIAADAIRRAGSIESAALQDALKKTDIKEHVMAGGPIQFNDKGQNPNIGIVMLQNLKGEPCVVLPTDIAEASPVVPMPTWASRS
jgi:branched-chain amino acid transport system substrate-binding protein